MSLLLPKSGRVELARAFYSNIVNPTASNNAGTEFGGPGHYFHFSLGKTSPWPDDEAPPAPVDSETFTKDFRKSIMFTQLITSSNVCHLANRVDKDWVSGRTYDPYDDDYSASRPAASGATSLADANFYVITDENKVYKCLDNRDLDGNVTTVSDKPTSTDTAIFSTNDNYFWKFLFQVSSADETAFLDVEHIPVRKLTGNPTHDVNGELDSVTVTAGGSGYTSVPEVLISGDGIGGSATAVLTGDAVTSVTINTAGSGYTFALITFSGGGGSGAAATFVLGDADALPALQSAVENTAVKGTVDKINLSNSGQGYTVGDVTVTITGDGSGAAASATIAADTGAITGITVTNRGSGYSFANITFTQSVGSGTGAIARAILSPINGHGSNPVKELFASTIGIVASVSENSNKDLIIGNDFRQIGLIKNLYNYTNSAIWTSNTATASFIIDVDNNAQYAVDDNITTDDGGQFTVVQLADDGLGTFQIHLQPIIGLITATSTLENTTKSLTGLSINSVINPEISVTSGDIMYIENRSPISRSADQVETIKALINF